jgi:endoglucanase
MLEKIDRVLRLAGGYGLHACLCMHHAPGYTVDVRRTEPFNLWKDELAADMLCFHWQVLARRYRGISSAGLSFNLVNEPPALVDERISREGHARVIRAATAAIRSVDADRLIIADGVEWASVPCPELADLGIAQSYHAYRPFRLTHYGVEGLRDRNWPLPTWPGSCDRDGPWDRSRLAEWIQQWADLARQGIGVHCGECACSNETPHDACLGWMRDLLEILTSHNIGYALWNLRGVFGVLDSERSDVAYEEWHGHSLDRAMLDLLQEF